MSSGKRWYELALGVVLLALGLGFLLLLAIAIWMFAQHEYTVDLSIGNPQRVLTLLSAVMLAVGVVSTLGGAALLRRR